MNILIITQVNEVNQPLELSRLCLCAIYESGDIGLYAAAEVKTSHFICLFFSFFVSFYMLFCRVFYLILYDFFCLFLSHFYDYLQLSIGSISAFNKVFYDTVVRKRKAKFKTRRSNIYEVNNDSIDIEDSNMY